MFQLILIIIPILLIFMFLKKSNKNKVNTTLLNRNIKIDEIDNENEVEKTIDPEIIIKTGYNFKNIFNNIIYSILINSFLYLILYNSPKNFQIIILISIIGNLLFLYFFLKNIYEISQNLINPYKSNK